MVGEGETRLLSEPVALALAGLVSFVQQQLRAATSAASPFDRLMTEQESGQETGLQVEVTLHWVLYPGGGEFVLRGGSFTKALAA